MFTVAHTNFISTTHLPDRFAGCLLGLALGDAMGAPREGGVAERLAWRVLGRTPDGRMRWTDDTQMTLALSESLIAQQGLVLDDAALRMARAHQWRRGYGPGAAKVLARIRRGEPWPSASRSVYPDGSYGNGGAMRVAPLALWFAPDAAAVWQAARDSAAITHAHEAAQWGAGAMALAVRTALLSGSVSAALSPDVFWRRWQLSVAAQKNQAGGHAYHHELQWVNEQLAGAASAAPHGLKFSAAGQAVAQPDGQTRRPGAQLAPSPREVQQHLGCDVAAQRSVITAIYLAARFMQQPFEVLLQFGLQLRGDVDTVLAMAGAIWGAARGRQALPQARLHQLEAAEHIEATARQLAALCEDAAAREAVLQPTAADAV